MKPLKYIFIAAVLVSAFAVTGISAKNKMVPRMYMFGFSASFTDSIVYFTNVQDVDNAWIESKGKFLLGRDNYSYQLRNYLADVHKMPNRTCVVIYALTKKKAEEKFIKMKRKYTVKAKTPYDVRYINDSDFRFNAIDMTPYNEDEPAAK